jgi:hypothetical protein
MTSLALLASNLTAFIHISHHATNPRIYPSPTLTLRSFHPTHTSLCPTDGSFKVYDAVREHEGRAMFEESRKAWGVFVMNFEMVELEPLNRAMALVLNWRLKWSQLLNENRWAES